MIRSLFVGVLLAGCTQRARLTGSTLVSTGIEQLDIQNAKGEWAPDPAHRLMPVGTWVRVGSIVAWSYVDPEQGLSVQWHDPGGGPGSVHVRRLQWAPLAMETVEGAPPLWAERYGPQPPSGTLHGTWRIEPGLSHRFHPDFPDDLRAAVGVEQGGRLLAEIVWIRLLACDGLRCTGSLLNQPDNVPGLALGSTVEFDLTGVDNDRFPVASRPGTPPPASLLSLTATAPEAAGQLQDREARTVDHSVPPAERLVPIGSWGVVGDEVAWFYLGEGGPGAAVFGRDGFRRESLTWAPRGLRLLTDEERRGAGMPEAPPIEGLPPQPPPGPWGTWRIDPATAWLFELSTDPDVAFVLVSSGGELLSAHVRVVGCDELACVGRLASTVGEHLEGTPMELHHRRLGDRAVDMRPVAWPLGSKPD